MAEWASIFLTSVKATKESTNQLEFNKVQNMAHDA
jgi:hypothetical protein